MAVRRLRRYYFLNACYAERHHLHVRALICMCSAALLTAEVSRLTPEDARLFDAAKQRYYEAVDGARDALNVSRDALQKLHSKSPADSLVLAYLGSTRLLEAARALAPWRKGKLAKEGLRMLDEAVQESPENLEIRFLRGISTSHLPESVRPTRSVPRPVAGVAAEQTSADRPPFPFRTAADR